MDESEAVAAFEDLGLTGYEAKVFVALQRLGTGTAREVHRVADVPRSQVYGVAESLEQRGLVEVQQSSPLQYRAVPPEEAEERLAERQQRTRERAFEFAESVRGEFADGEEMQEDIWTVRGRDAVDRRIRRLVADAGERVVVGVADPALLSAETVAALEERADAGASVVVVSDDADVRAAFEDGAVETVGPPSRDRPRADRAGRVLAVDGETILLSVRGTGDGEETAIWSAGTGFAAVQLRLLDAWLGEAASV